MPCPQPSGLRTQGTLTSSSFSFRLQGKITVYPECWVPRSCQLYSLTRAPIPSFIPGQKGPNHISPVGTRVTRGSSLNAYQSLTNKLSIRLTFLLAHVSDGVTLYLIILDLPKLQVFSCLFSLPILGLCVLILHANTV